MTATTAVTCGAITKVTPRADQQSRRTTQVLSPVTKSLIDKVIHNPDLLSRIFEYASTPTRARCLRVCSHFFRIVGPLLYRAMELDLDTLLGPMQDGLDVPIQHGYRILRPTQRNTMLPLLQQIHDLSLVVSTSSPVSPAREIYDPLTSALCNVKVLRLFFGDVEVERNHSGYGTQPVLELLSIAPRAQHYIFSFHPDIDLAWFGGSLDDSEIDGEPYDSHLFRRQITLIVGSRRPCIPDPFRSFDTIRVVLASRAVEHDVRLMGFSLMPELASGVLPTAMEEYNSGIPDWALCSTLREACRIRYGQATDIFLLDDLAILNDDQMHAGSLKEVYANVMASEGVDAAHIAAIRPRTRKEFLETCPGVLSPEVTAWYQRLEDSTAALKMQTFREPHEERHVAFLLGEWNLTIASEDCFSAAAQIYGG